MQPFGARPKAYLNIHTASTVYYSVFNSMKPKSRAIKHRSPGLTAIYNAVCSHKHNEVLDLGPCVAANFAFLSKLGCRFHFENVIDDLKELQSRQLNQFISAIKLGDQYNVVLMWDIWNYLSVAQQAALCQELEPYLKPGALLHSIHYVGARRPQAPMEFKVIDQYYLEVKQNSASVPNNNQASTIERLKALHNFKVLRSYISMQDMYGGISEQILCYSPGEHMSQGVFSFSEMATSLPLLRYSTYMNAQVINQVCAYWIWVAAV